MTVTATKKLQIKMAESRHGRFAYYERDKFIGYGLERYGEYSEDEVALLCKLVKPGAIVVEVGANIGAITVPLAKHVGEQGFVYALEPQPENCTLLARNIERNGLSRCVHIFRRAASAGVANARIPALDELSEPNYGAVEIGSGQIEIELDTLDSILSNAEYVDLIKIDVEGMEAEVLRGAEHVLKCRPLLYVENDRPEKSAELLALIKGLGYRIYDHRPLIFNCNNYRAEPLAREDERFISLNILCIPEEKVSQYAEIVADLQPVIPASPNIGKKGWVCIVRCGGIGDNLVAASVLRPLKAQGYKVEVITQAPQACLFENNPFIDKLSVRKQGDLPADFKQWSDYFRLRSREYDRFVNLSHSMEGMLAMVEGSMAWDWPAAFRRKLCGMSYLEAAHEIVGVPFDFGPLFFPTDEEKEQAFATLRKVSNRGAKKVVAWCLAGSRLDKLYPMTGLAIARLIKELGCEVIMFGAPERVDFEMAKAIQDHVKLVNSTDAGLHLALSPIGTESWPMRRAITTAMLCDLVITPDTGLAWGVAMESVPKIMLHSHASQKNITAHWRNTISMIPSTSVTCWPCHKLHNKKETCEEEQVACGMKVDPEAKGAACISSISVEDIITAARSRLTSGGF